MIPLIISNPGQILQTFMVGIGVSVEQMGWTTDPEYVNPWRPRYDHYI